MSSITRLISRVQTRRGHPVLPRTHHLGTRTWQPLPRFNSSLASLPAQDVERPPPTKVEKILLDNIKATGPISFASYMAFCLAHPTHGYYTNSENAVFGSRGDFITSPEISQVFGELLATWLLSRYLEVEAKTPSLPRRPLRLVELGPGRGTLMADVLRVLTQLSLFRNQGSGSTGLASIHLVETSLPLREQQAALLQPLADQLGAEIVWYDTLEDVLPDVNVFTGLLAHEFFDALPVRVIQKTQNGWTEVLIANADRIHENPAPTPAQDNTSTEETSLGNHPGSSSNSNSQPTSGSSLSSASNPRPLDVTTPGFGGPSVSPSAEKESAANPYRFQPVLSPSNSADATLLGALSPRFAALPVGARIEVSAEAARIAGLVGGLLSPLEGSSASASASTSSLGAGASASTEAGTETGGGQEISSLKTVDSGAALIIDYGSYGAATDSFRAFKQHAQLSPFAKPGECDLTADVDFALVGEAASPHARPLRLLTQREFLVRLPLAQRVERLLKGKEDGRKAEIVGAVGRLVDDGEGGMGGQYKVLGVVGKGSRDGRGNSREEEEDVYPFVEMPKES